MKFINQAGWDRILRVFGGIALIVLYFADVLTGTLGIILAVAGGVFLVTGLAGWCPIYAMFRIRTNREVGAS